MVLESTVGVGVLLVSSVLGFVGYVVFDRRRNVPLMRLLWTQLLAFVATMSLWVKAAVVLSIEWTTVPQLLGEWLSRANVWNDLVIFTILVTKSE